MEPYRAENGIVICNNEVPRRACGGFDLDGDCRVTLCDKQLHYVNHTIPDNGIRRQLDVQVVEPDCATVFGNVVLKNHHLEWVPVVQVNVIQPRTKMVLLYDQTAGVALGWQSPERRHRLVDAVQYCTTHWQTPCVTVRCQNVVWADELELLADEPDADDDEAEDADDELDDVTASVLLELLVCSVELDDDVWAVELEELV